MTLALFDFDGTITTDDSLLKFIRFVIGDVKFITGVFALSPILLAYKLGLVPNYKAKQILLSYFFKGFSENEFKKISNEYSLSHIDKITRPKAIERLQWHKEQNHTVVIVSASIDCWLKPWCDKNEFKLIATKLKISDGVITGELLTKNCYGIEKLNRIKEIFELSRLDYIYAYGDSSGDKEMLAVANESFYKPFRS